MLWGAAAVLEMQPDRSGLLEGRSEMSHDVKEFLDDVEKSSHVVEDAVAVVLVFRHDGFGAESLVEESLPVGLPTKSVASGPRDNGFESTA